MRETSNENYLWRKKTVSHRKAESRVSVGVPASLLEYLHACPICEGRDLRHYCRVPSLFNPGEFICYEKCKDCGIVLRNPRLPADYRLSLYEDKILPDKAKELIPKSQVHYAHMMRRLDRLAPRDGRRLLDFGCGSGGFLLEARKAGFDVMGLELNRDLARHVTAEYGIPTFQGLISAPELAAERFQVVISSQVFEHLLDPRETLKDIKKLLEPPGIVLIEVPNLHDVRERLRRGSRMNDSHLFYFSSRSLSRMFRDCGFQVLRVEQGLRPYRYFNEGSQRLPAGLFGAAERVLSAFGIRTGLGVIARLDPAAG